MARPVRNDLENYAVEALADQKKVDGAQKATQVNSSWNCSFSVSWGVKTS
jgi:hypothetical protein